MAVIAQHSHLRTKPGNLETDVARQFQARYKQALLIMHCGTGTWTVRWGFSRRTDCACMPAVPLCAQIRHVKLH